MGYLKKIFSNFLAVLKIGSGRKLFVFDLIAWSIITYDLIKIKSQHLYFYLWPKLTVGTLVLAGLLIYVPPLISAYINFVFRNVKIFRNTIGSYWRDRSFIFHWITSLAFALYIAISSELKVLSGFQATYVNSITTTLSSYEYSPFYHDVVYKIAWSFLLGFIISVASFFGYRKELKSELILWFRLANSSSDYFPKQKANLIFVNTASMAPTINWISTKEESYRHTYQKKVPTSDDAKHYLTSAAEESRGLLREYLFQENRERGGEFSVEFLPGTSRALEVGLTQIENLGTVVVSPYEHPSQNDVVEWFVATFNPSIKHEKLRMDYSVLHKSWHEQKARLIEQVRSAISAADHSKKIAILISEVHYLTGMVIIVNEIIEDLRPNYRNSSLVFMVDGSQSVGNLLRPLNTLANNLHREDFYYFSAHKWLLSPNTCGVFVAEQNASRFAIQPYDLFGAGLPSATVDPGVIFGIRSSLQYLIGHKMANLKKFNETSNLLKSYFVENIGDQFEVIQSDSKEMNRSLFIAVRPRSGYRWKDESVEDFWIQITGAGVDLTRLDLEGSDAQTWWLRISFPYFVQLHLLKQLIKHLRARVTSIN
jgi:selenocysteine lyase/cysteine desulfurase